MTDDPDRRPRVLVVDDNRDAAASLADLLDLLGFDARFCLDGPAALVLAADVRPTACVLDINMPVLDGYGLARWLRASMGEAVRLVALTGVGGDDLPRRAADAGFDAVFLKPADAGKLVAALAPLAPAAEPGIP